jgi:hypothetical protein
MAVTATECAELQDTWRRGGRVGPRDRKVLLDSVVDVAVERRHTARGRQRGTARWGTGIADETLESRVLAVTQRILDLPGWRVRPLVCAPQDALLFFRPRPITVFGAAILCRLFQYQKWLSQSRLVAGVHAGSITKGRPRSCASQPTASPP